MGVKSRFVWHDFMAADVGGAKRFYGELFGWTFKPGDHDYEHIQQGGQEIGGLMKLDPQHGAPPHWVGYVAVDDVDAAVAAVKKSGGQVYVQETIPNVGTFAVCADGQGAVFAPFHHTGRGSDQPERDDRSLRYRFCWDELLTTNPEAAVKFYNTLFGWSHEHMDMPGFRYTLLKRPGVKDETGADKNAAGVMQTPPGVPHSFWLTYVSVENADATCEKAKKLGAKVMRAPEDIPNVGRFAVLTDPQNGSFAVLQPFTA
jgi:predicted enzyme related to lactoylglutathione lyase